MYSNELKLHQQMQARAKQDSGAISFLGAGRYQHYIPPVVTEIAQQFADYPINNDNQGSLSALYHYQQQMQHLTKMPAVSLGFDSGVSALLSALLMAKKSQAGHDLLLPSTIAPRYQTAVQQWAIQQDMQVILIDYDSETGGLTVDELIAKNTDKTFALILPYPNFFGGLEAIDELSKWAKQQNITTIAVVNPLALALETTETWQHIDIICGQGQPLGLPMNTGFGFLSCRQDLQPYLSGHWVEKTPDGWHLSSNDTQHDLLPLIAGIYLSLQTPQGLTVQAEFNQQQLNKVFARCLDEIEGITSRFSAVTFNEVVVKLDRPVKPILRSLAAHNFLAAYDLGQDYPELEQCLLICVTEMHSETDIDKYIAHLKRVIRPLGIDMCAGKRNL